MAHTIRLHCLAPGSAAMGQGVPVVYDSVGRATFRRSPEYLAPRGLLIPYGNSGTPEPLLAHRALETQETTGLTVLATDGS